MRTAASGRNRRRGRVSVFLAVAGLLLVLASGAMLSPALLGWPLSIRTPATAPIPGAPVTSAGWAATTPPAAGPTPPPSPAVSASARPRPSTQPLTSTASGVEALENRVLALTNAERAEQGCPALRMDTKLRAAARGYSEEMRRYGAWNHIGHDGSNPGERMRRAGYDTSEGWGENIAKGYPSAEAVMKGWMNSSGHRANILNCDMRALGVGVVRAGNGQLYWTQDFGGR
jgi:uncharacterized protein YkwD